MRYMTRFMAPDDRGAPKLPDEPSQHLPSQTQFRGEGSIGPTMGSRVGEALSHMGPGDAADTGGIAIDPTVINPPTFTAESWLIDQESTEGEVPAGGMADNWLEQEDAFRARRNDLEMGDLPHDVQTRQESPELSDEERWRP